MHPLPTVLFIALAADTACAQAPTSETRTKVAATDLLAKLERARSPGYSMLLRQLHVPEDRERFGAFFDHGPLRVGHYAGHRDLPVGYWVYVQPYWYVFRDRLPAKANRSYGPEQAVGPPTTTVGGDSTSAWCPKLMNSPEEWLIAEYAKPVKATAVLVRENYTPGSVRRITLFTLDGREVELWKADKVGGIKAAIRTMRAELPLGFSVTRIKLYLATKEVAGWQEIDAIGLIDDRGQKHWATAVAASSTYAPVIANVPADTPRTGPSPDAKSNSKSKTEKSTKVDMQRARRVAALESRIEKLEAEIAKKLATLEALRAELRATRKKK